MKSIISKQNNHTTSIQAKSNTGFRYIVEGEIATMYDKTNKHADFSTTLKFTDKTGKEHTASLVNSGECSSASKAYLYAIYNAVSSAKVPCTVRLSGATEAQKQAYSDCKAGKAIRNADAWKSIIKAAKENHVRLELI